MHFRKDFVNIKVNQHVVLNMLQFCILLFLILCVSQDGVATCLRHNGKYNDDITANLLLRPTVKEF